MSDSVWPHRRQPTRLPRPWGSPGKNTGVGCHFLLQCMKVKSESEVAQSCLLSDPMDCSLPGSSIHGIFQARVLEWVTKTPYQGLFEIPWLAIFCMYCHPSMPGKWCCLPSMGRRNPMWHFSCTLPYVSLPLADFNLCPLPVINCEYNSF